MPDRRNVLKAIGIAAVASVCRWKTVTATERPAQEAGLVGPYSLPPLPYAYDALEPYIDARTMHLHHDKHHAAYVKNLNAAVAAYPDLGKLPVDQLIQRLETVPESIRMAVRNNGGGHSNHSLFWQIMQKNSFFDANTDLAKAIDSKFGVFSEFKAQFTKAALSVFGSGWAWITLDDKKELAIETTPNQDSPLMAGRTPILGIDVWEHAYYLKYQNVRADYIAAFCKVISWDFANKQFQKAMLSA